MKKTLFKITALTVAALTVFPAFGCGKKSESGLNANVWSTYSTLKVVQDAKDFFKTSAHIEVYAAKGESESGQIILTPDEEIKSVSVSLSDLSTDDGDTFDKANVKVFWQKYIKVEQKTTNQENYRYPEGMYPDMLLPLEKAIDYGENNVGKGLNQGLTFDFYVPKDTKAGEYKGSFKIVMDDVEKSIPVSLTVWDFELGRANGYTCFQIWQTTMMYGELNNTDAEYKKYFETFLNDYKTCPQYLPNAGNGADAFVASVKEYWDNENLTTINIPTFGDATDYSFVEPEFKNYIKALAVECTPNTIYFDRAIVYLTTVDEPQGIQAETAVKRITDKIRNICNDVYDELVATDFFSDFGGEDGQFAKSMKESLSGIQIVVTAQSVSGYGNSIDTCCPYISVYSTEYDGDVLREHGNGTWMYTCMAPIYPYPSHHIDDYLIGGRILRWIQKANNIDGYLYWGVSEYYNQGLGTMVNPYEDSVRWSNGVSLVNGDGYLLYPGFKYGSDTPFGSLRALTLRDGQEDYDMLCLLENIVNGLSDYYQDDNLCLENVITDLYDKICQRTIYNSDDQVFDSVRKEIAAVIDRANNYDILVTDVKKSGNGFTYSVYAPQNSVLKVDGKNISGSVSGQGVRFDISVTDGQKTSSLVVETGNDSIRFEKQLKGELVKAIDFSALHNGDVEVSPNSDFVTDNGTLAVQVRQYSEGDDPTLIDRFVNLYFNGAVDFLQIENLYITVTNNADADVVMTIMTDNEILLEKIKLKAGVTRDICIKNLYEIKNDSINYADGLTFYFDNAYTEKNDGQEQYVFYPDVQLVFNGIYYTEKAGE